MRTVRLFAIIVILLGAVACGDDEPVTPTEPTAQPTPTTRTFSETLTVNGARTHEFATNRSGQISVTVTELAPDGAAVIGLSLGTWNGTSCQIVLANDNATQASTILGTSSAAGNFCARVYDVGRLSSATSYTITVVHF